MNNESNEIWQAMKEAKYRDSFEELQEKCEKAYDLNTILYTILDTIVKAAHAEAGTLWFYDFYGSGKIEPKIVYGGGDIHSVALNYGEGIIGKVIKENKGLLISDCHSDENFNKQIDKQSGFNTKSMICVPIGKDKAFAGIQIINKTDGNLYDEKDYDFINSLAIESSKLFYRLSEKLLFGDNGKNLVNKIENFVISNSSESIIENLSNGLIDSKYSPRDQRKIVKYSTKLIKIFNKEN